MCTNKQRAYRSKAMFYTLQRGSSDWTYSSQITNEYQNHYLSDKTPFEYLEDIKDYPPMDNTYFKVSVPTKNVYKALSNDKKRRAASRMSALSLSNKNNMANKRKVKKKSSYKRPIKSIRKGRKSSPLVKGTARSKKDWKLILTKNGEFVSKFYFEKDEEYLVNDKIKRARKMCVQIIQVKQKIRFF